MLIVYQNIRYEGVEELILVMLYEESKLRLKLSDDDVILKK